MIHSTLSKGIFSDLISKSIEHMSTISDNRKSSNATKYNIESAGMGALSVFLMQHPSFLSYQKKLLSSTGQSNFANLFGGIKEIPSANQIKNILDEVSPDSFNQLFDNGLSTLIKDGLEKFKIMNKPNFHFQNPPNPIQTKLQTQFFNLQSGTTRYFEFFQYFLLNFRKIHNLIKTEIINPKASLLYQFGLG